MSVSRSPPADESEAATPLSRARPASGDAARAPTPVVEVRSLVGSGREAVLLHEGDRYRLRITANNKLILTK